jgi:hypothetical protein
MMPMIANPNFPSSLLLVFIADTRQCLCPCVMCHGELSSYVTDHHSDLCCSISHGDAHRRADGLTDLEGEGLDLGQRKLT